MTWVIPESYLKQGGKINEMQARIDKLEVALREINEAARNNPGEMCSAAVELMTRMALSNEQE